jgi:TRAP-type C4-dicarboxylate transport system permease small subunit
LLSRLALALGGLGLALAVGFGVLGVAARHLGLSLPGAIELIQPCIVAVVASALVVATLERTHAAAHLFTARAPPAWRRPLERLAAALAAFVFGALFVGEAWLFVELWPAHERGDLTGLPVWPQRALWSASLLLCAVLSLLGAVRGGPADG